MSFAAVVSMLRTGPLQIRCRRETSLSTVKNKLVGEGIRACGFVKGFVSAVILNDFRSLLAYSQEEEVSYLAYTHAFDNPWCIRIDNVVKGKSILRHQVLVGGLVSA